MSSDVDTQPHLDALERGVIIVQSCPACGHRQFPPRAICVRCAEPPEWIEIDGRGVIYAITTCHRAGEPWLEDRVPYSVALVDLSEGLRLLGRITGEPLDHHAIGVAVLAHVTRDPRTAPAIEFLLDELEVDR